MSLLIFGVDHRLKVVGFQDDLLSIFVEPLYTPQSAINVRLFTSNGYIYPSDVHDNVYTFAVKNFEWVIPQVEGINSFNKRMTGCLPWIIHLDVYRREPELFVVTSKDSGNTYIGIKVPQGWKIIDCTLDNVKFDFFTLRDFCYFFTKDKLKDGIKTFTIKFQLPHDFVFEYKSDIYTLNGFSNILRGNTTPYVFEPVSPGKHVVKPGETLWQIAMHYGLRVADLEIVNNIEDGSKILAGSTLKLARVKFKESITTVVINVATARIAVYYDGTIVKQFPAAIGRSDATPLGRYTIIKKEIDPALYWFGEYIPPRSPINGLGTRYLQLSNPTYGIHGTTKPWEIGKRISHGCIRMLNQDVESLDAFIDIGTHVIVVKNFEPFPEQLPKDWL